MILHNLHETAVIHGYAPCMNHKKEASAPSGHDPVLLLQVLEPQRWSTGPWPEGALAFNGLNNGLILIIINNDDDINSNCSSNSN